MRHHRKFLRVNMSGIFCFLILSGCDVLGLKFSSTQYSEAMEQDRAVNIADKHRMGGKTVPVDENHMVKVSAEQKQVEKKAAPTAAEIDCSKIDKNNQSVYLQSHDGKGKIRHVKVGATGYGAPPKNYYPEGQRRLLTIRASKIDAYRALAEIVGGLHIWGGSSIGDMVVERDRYSVFVDTYVRGARVINVTPMEDNTYKTVVEMDVDERFLSQVMAFIAPTINHHCVEHKKNNDSDSYAYNTGNNLNSSFYYSE